jgi:hypothetical protein
MALWQITRGYMFNTCQFEHVKVKGSKSSGMTIVLPSFWGSVKQYMQNLQILKLWPNLRWLWHVTSSRYIKTRVLHPPFQRCKQKVAQTSGVRQTCPSKAWDQKNTHKYRHWPTIQASLGNPYSMHVKSQLVLDACHPLNRILSFTHPWWANRPTNVMTHVIIELRNIVKRYNWTDWLNKSVEKNYMEHLETSWNILSFGFSSENQESGKKNWKNTWKTPWKVESLGEISLPSCSRWYAQAGSRSPCFRKIWSL